MVHEYRLRSACRYMKGLIRQVRSQAASNNCYMGIVFDDAGGKPEISIYGDGNSNGIRRKDINDGIDKRVRGPFLLDAQFPGVRFGSPPGNGHSVLPGLRIGTSKILSFSPLGASTSGTIFFSNENGTVGAVILLGATGRVRTVRYYDGRWEPFS